MGGGKKINKRKKNIHQMQVFVWMLQFGFAKDKPEPKRQENKQSEQLECEKVHHASHCKQVNMLPHK